MFNVSNGYTFQLDDTGFRKKIKTKNLLTLDDGYSISGSSSERMSQSILGTIGEGLERQIMLSNDLENLNKKFSSLDLRTKKEVIFTIDDTTSKFFFDTCGLSTHLNSQKCLNNSISEFIERQSFIFSYLSKTSGQIVEKNSFFKSIIPSKYHHLNYFEISLTSLYRVIFAIGIFEENSISIGLGAGYTSEEALKKLLAEIHDPIIHGKMKPEKDEDIDYIHLFHMLTIEDIIQAYKYLENTEKIFLPKKEKKYELEEVLDDLYRRYNINPKCIFLCKNFYNERRYGFSKNIKVFDFNWFPSLNLYSFDEKIYHHVEKNTGKVLNRNINFIPFP